MLAWIGRIWRQLKKLYAFLLPIRFSFLALAVLIFAFIASDQGKDILRALLEDRKPGTQFRLMLLIVAVNVLAYVIWYWSRQLLRYRPAAAADKALASSEKPLVVEDAPTATEWTPRILGLFAFIFVIVGFLVTAGQYRGNAWPVRIWWAIGWLVITGAVYFWFVIRRRRMFGLSNDSMQTATSWRRSFARGTKVALSTTIVIEVALLLFAWCNPVAWRYLGVAAVVVVTISIWVPVGSALVALGEYWRFPILAALLVWAFAISRCADNHVIRRVDTPMPPRPTLSEAFDTWYARVSAMHPDGNVPVVIVATEGGGIRAAYWTATVLTAMQDQIPSFADHCFAISGVSGGSVGATVFDSLLAQRQDSPLSAPPDADHTLHGESRTMLSFDALSADLAALSQPDLLQRFVPIPKFPDRARALEHGWEEGWRQTFPSAGREQFASGLLQMTSSHPRLPLLFLNGTVVETGERIVASSVRLRPFTGFRNAFDMFDQLGTDIPASTAAHTSARFTYVSPAGIVSKGIGGTMIAHVVDGGYFENSGAVTAAEVIEMLDYKRTVEQKTTRPIVIIIDFFENASQPPTDPKPFFPAPGAGGPAFPVPPKPQRFASEVLSPPLAILNARGARGLLAIGDMVERMNGAVLEFRLIRRGVPLPLGWVLSDTARDAIDSAVDCEGGNRTAARLLAQRLTGTPLPANWSDPVSARSRGFLQVATGEAPPPCVSPANLVAPGGALVTTGSTEKGKTQ